jgi:putative nucleotidyltransferase with HDIG domain
VPAVANITDYIDDIGYIQEIIGLTKSIYGINAYIEDSEGRVVDGLGLDIEQETPFKKFYPFEFTEDIGGLRCLSANEESIARADRFINTAVAALNALLQRELEIQQMGIEIVELSEQVNFLFNLAKKVVGIKKLQEFCEMSLLEIVKKIQADSGFIIVKDSQDRDTVIPHNLSTNEAVDMQNQEAFNLALQKKDTILSRLDNGMSALVSPIDVKDGIIGFMAFFREKGKRFFTAYEKKLVSIIDNSIASTIETLRLYDSLKELYLNTVKALAAAIDAKDPYTHGHSFRVAKYSMAIAKKMGFTEDAVADVEIAGYMHDIGKIGILDSVLNKAGRLTEDEYVEIKKHPRITHKILEPIRLPDNIVLAAAQHHEKINGTGYPLGLAGDEMHEFAKIIAVADVFDALTSDRPYRPSMSVEKALTVLCEDADKAFEREVVLALIEEINDGITAQNVKDIYRDLKYHDLQNLNQFLIMLTGLLMVSVSAGESGGVQDR